ncbi:MAG: hypothetical protein K8E24_013050 [Methanobacterium paludis]|nr:hypothetical protein [Methanobacterium paludis]
MASYADLKIFHPELIKTMFLEVRPPQRTYNQIFNGPSALGLYSFSMGSFSDPFSILPPVEDLEDAKSMFADQSIEDYKLQDYRGFVDISNKLINQFQKAGNMAGLITQLRERYAMVLREGYENTVEYTCYNAMEDKHVDLSTSHDWTAGATTADEIIEDLQKAKQAFYEETRMRADTVILNPEAETQVILRKELSNMLYNSGNNAIETGEIGRMLNLRFMTQAGGFTDSEGADLSMFQPTTTGKALAYVTNGRAMGYPVVFGTPDFTTVDNPSKNSVRIYVNAHCGFVYNRPLVEKITA